MAIDKEVFDKAKDAMRTNSPKNLDTANAMLTMLPIWAQMKAMQMGVRGCSDEEIAEAIEPLCKFGNALINYIDEKN